MDIFKSVQQINEWIQQGQILLAKKEIKKILSSKAFHKLNKNQNRRDTNNSTKSTGAKFTSPQSANLQFTGRELKCRLSNLCRRVGWANESLQLLRDLFHPDATLQPTLDEQLSYGASLAAIGIRSEAKERLLKLLQSPSQTIQSQVLLHLGLLEMNQWNYSGAKKYFLKLVKNTSTSSYQKLIGYLNLGACYSYSSQFALAEKVLLKVYQRAQKENLKLVTINALEVLAQGAFFQSNQAKAIEYINILEPYLHINKKDENSFYALSLLKWKALILKPNNYQQDLLNIRQRSLQYKYYELVRDCDLYLAVAQNNEHWIRHLIYGSPQKGYLNKVRYLLNRTETHSQTSRPLRQNKGNFYLWPVCNYLEIEKLSTPNISNKNIFDIDMGIWNGQPTTLVKSKKGLRLLQVLSQDFYRPLSLGPLFNQLYPNEYYNPLSSPGRVYKVVQRVQQLLIENHIPLKIEQQNNEFKLVRQQSCYILRRSRIILNRQVVANENKNGLNASTLLRLKKWAKRQWFGSKSASQAMGVSTRHLRRWLQPLITSRQIECVGNTRQRLFRFSY